MLIDAHVQRMEGVSNTEHQERDEFDIFGQAALTDYELTQQPGTEVRHQLASTSNGHNLDNELKDEGSDTMCLLLQEQLCTLEGEKKYLRTRNEKLELQLKNAEENRRKCQAVFDQEAVRHKEAVKSNLAFKEKEIQDLMEKCQQLSEKLKRQQMSVRSNSVSSLHVVSTAPHVSLPTGNNQQSNSFFLDAQPARKRPRLLSSDESGSSKSIPGEREPVVVNHDVGHDVHNQTVPRSFIFACHLNIALANEGESDLVKGLIKKVLSEHPSCDCGYLDVPSIVSTEQDELLECLEFESAAYSHEPSCGSNVVSDVSELSAETLNNSLPVSSHPVSLGDDQSSQGIEDNSFTTVSSDGSEVHNAFIANPSSSFPACLRDCLNFSSSYLSLSLYDPKSCVLYSCDSGHSTYNVSLLRLIGRTVGRYYAGIRSVPAPETSISTQNLSKGDTCGSGISESESETMETEASSSCLSDSSSPTMRLPSLSPSSYCSSCSSQSTCCSCSSSGSQESGSLVALQRRHVLQVFLVLRALCKYNKQARQDVVMAKHSCELFDSFSLFGHSCEFSDDGSMDEGTSPDSSAAQTVKYKEALKNGELSIVSSDLLSDQILLGQDQTSNIPSPFQSLKPVDGPSHSVYNGNLFELLLCTVVTLTGLHLKKETDVLNIALEILIALTEECGDEHLERYSLLIQKDQNSLESLLRREDPLITLNVLTLLTEISRSSSIVALLCSSSKSCVLGNCYTLFCKPPSPVNSDVTIQIWMQLVRFICQVLCTKGGEVVLLESSCGCSLSLLRSLLSCLVDVVHTIHGNTDDEESTLIRESRCLLQMMFTAVHSIMQHSKQCEELRQDVKSRYRCLYSINTCLNWSEIPEELLHDLCHFVLSDDEEDDEEDRE